MEGKKFVTAINCIDGRVQTCVIDWLKQQYQADFVDMITEPGCDKVLAEGPSSVIDAIKEKVLISVGPHHSDLVAVVGHYDCAANPVSKEEHFAQIAKGVELIKSWGLPITVLGLWVGETWEVAVL